jgi:autotransporter strand-loop-strand O-heptosyltransferase
MNSKEFKGKIISEIETTKIKHKETIRQININLHFVGNPFLEITGNVEDDYVVRFYDGKELIHQSTIRNNMWTKVNRKYYTDWCVEVFNSRGVKIFKDKINLNSKRVYIAFGSKSLGDTLAWIPYAEEFRKKHNCELIVSTFLNDLFIDQYPEIKFVKPGEVVNNLYSMYEIGWFYRENDIDYYRVPNNFRTQPLQKTATDILGLDYTEIQPKLKLKTSINREKKVGIAIHGTSQAKYWNNQIGWQEVVDYLNHLGYKVILYSIEGDGYMGNNHPSGINQFPKSQLQNVIYDMQTCDLFIGIGSGLSWLAWSVGLPVVLISGFSETYTETQKNTYRVINENVCRGCFNSHRLDAGDWNWCPINKGTEKQFECSKSIKSSQIIDKINNILKIGNYQETVKQLDIF